MALLSWLGLFAEARGGCVLDLDYALVLAEVHLLQLELPGPAQGLVGQSLAEVTGVDLQLPPGTFLLAFFVFC